MKRIHTLIALILAGIILISCKAANLLPEPTQEPSPTAQPPTEEPPTLTPSLPASEEPLTPTAASPATLTTTKSIRSSSPDVSLEYPESWYVQENPASAPFSLLITSFNPASPPHKLEWDSQTVSIGIREIPAGEAPVDLDAWAEKSKQEAEVTHLQVAGEERITVGQSIQAVRLTFVSGSGGIVDQVLVIHDDQAYEILVQGNFDLVKPVLDTLQITSPLKPPDSESPVSGICASAEGEIVEITLTVDGPAMPRCVKVTANQRLKFINGKDHEVQIILAHFSMNLPPGGEALLDQPVGEYLAPGDHLIEGVEIILLEEKDAFSPTIEIPPSP